MKARAAEGHFSAFAANAENGENVFSQVYLRLAPKICQSGTEGNTFSSQKSLGQPTCKKTAVSSLLSQRVHLSGSKKCFEVLGHFMAFFIAAWSNINNFPLKKEAKRPFALKVEVEDCRTSKLLSCVRVRENCE